MRSDGPQNGSIVATRGKKKAPKRTASKADSLSRRERYDTASDALGSLGADEADAIVGALTSHVAIHGERERGALRAAIVAVRAVLGVELSDPERAIAKRLALVGRGVATRSPDADTSPDIRWLAGVIDRERARSLGSAGQAEAIARATRRAGFGGDVDKIANALRRKSRAAVTAAVALACGILSGNAKRAYDRTVQALRE